MDKKIFAIWIGICVLGALLLGQIPSSGNKENTNNSDAFTRCLEENNLLMSKEFADEIVEEIIKEVEELQENAKNNIYDDAYSEKSPEANSKLSEHARLTFEKCGKQI